MMKSISMSCGKFLLEFQLFANISQFYRHHHSVLLSLGHMKNAFPCVTCSSRNRKYSETYLKMYSTLYSKIKNYEEF